MIENLLEAFWPDWNGKIGNGPSGWNNTTCFIHHEKRSSVLRIYNTHRDRAKIEFELAVLESLQRLPLSFKIPLPIPASSGERMVRIQDGSDRYACLFLYIEGARPEGDNLQAAYSLGEKAGELVGALAHMNMDIPPVYRPYFELRQSYPACSESCIREFCEHPTAEFRDLSEELHILKEAYIDICGKLDDMKNLPQQLVHGDLNFSNLLVDSDQPSTVSALLDFEFCTRDVRAMEPAVIISGFLGAAGEREAVNEFCQGFGSRVRLSPQEMEAIPVLIRLRMVDVFLHFMSRYLEGIDPAQVLREQVGMLAVGLQQLERSSEWMGGIMKRHLI